MFRKAISWFTTVFALGFVCLACRNPDKEAHRPPDQVAQPRDVKPTKNPNIKRTPVETLAGQIARSDKGQRAPVTAGEKVVATTPPGNAAKGSKESQATTENPADQATLPQVAVARPMDQVARNDKGQGAPVTAGEKVVALTPPANAAQGSEESRATAENPADQAALAQVARGDKDWSVRKAAVERLTSQAVLAQIATSDEDLDLRKLAVSRLTVQAVLAKVATSDNDWSVRKAAVERLTSQAILAQIAMSDEDLDIRKLAVSVLTDQTALARIARSDMDWSVRRSAVSKLMDKAVLAQIATSDQDPDIRKLAVSKLTDQAATP